MTESKILELFEGGEHVLPEGGHTPLQPLGIAIVLELHERFPKAGEDALRGMMRVFFEATFKNQEGLTGEIGRVIGKGKPIEAGKLARAEEYRPFVRKRLLALLEPVVEDLRREATK